jgi:hypothetical protein
MGGHCWQDGGSKDFIGARNEYYATLRDNATVPHCLIKNLTEMDSLPHLRNLTEISLLIDGMEGKDEVDDERRKVGREGDGGALREGAQEGERRDAGRVNRANWL